MLVPAGYTGRVGQPSHRLAGSVDILTLGMTAVPSYVTFTRASTGTWFDSAGTLQTASSNVARFDYNPLTLQPRGLLMEGARTNLFLNSATLGTQDVTVTAVAHTISFYGTGSITLSGAATATINGTGAFPNRVTSTFTPTAGLLTCTVTGSVLNAQIEVGTFASSWIPTTATTATRAADVATITNLANIGYNPTQGTILANYEIPFGWVTGTNEQAVVFVSDGTNNNRMQITRSGTGTISIFSNAAAVAQTNQVDGGGVRSSPLTTKTALAYNTNDYAVCSTGLSAVSSAAAATVPTVDRMTIGSRLGGSELFGYIRGLTYYSGRLPNAQLQAITA